VGELSQIKFALTLVWVFWSFVLISANCQACLHGRFCTKRSHAILSPLGLFMLSSLCPSNQVTFVQVIWSCQRQEMP